MTEASFVIPCPYRLTVRKLAEKTKKACGNAGKRLHILFPARPPTSLTNFPTSRKPLRRRERKI